MSYRQSEFAAGTLANQCANIVCRGSRCCSCVVVRCWLNGHIPLSVLRAPNKMNFGAAFSAEKLADSVSKIGALRSKEPIAVRHVNSLYEDSAHFGIANITQ